MLVLRALMAGVAVLAWAVPSAGSRADREAPAVQLRDARATGARGAARSVRPVTRSTRPARRPAVASPTRLQRAEAIADSSGWDWRRAGVAINVGFHPVACCHWGIYDTGDGTIWIGPTAFANDTRLRYTVLHELGHAWQWRSGHLDQLAADMARWRHRGDVRLEAGADCVSVVWGASRKAGHYWACPPAAANLVDRRLAGDWSP